MSIVYFLRFYTIRIEKTRKIPPVGYTGGCKTAKPRPLIRSAVTQNSPGIQVSGLLHRQSIREGRSSGRRIPEPVQESGSVLLYTIPEEKSSSVIVIGSAVFFNL